MKITIDERYRPHLHDRLAGHDLTFYDYRTVTQQEFIDCVRGADILAMARAPAFHIDGEMTANFPLLQFLHKSGTGADHFDVEALTAQGIVLAMNTGFNAGGVAEHAITLIMLTLRNTVWHIENLRNGRWNRDVPPGDVLSVAGKTIGIVGLGRSGARVAKVVTAMGAQVIAYQRVPKPEVEVLGGLRLASTLDELLQVSDVVTLHVPHTRATDKLIGARELALMKPSAVLINCARGRVVDETALIDALASGTIRGAGIDVFEDEPPSMDNPLLHFQNVVATPHVAGGTAESQARSVEATLSNVELFVRGELPHRIVNPEVLTSDALRAKHLRKAT